MSAIVTRITIAWVRTHIGLGGLAGGGGDMTLNNGMNGQRYVQLVRWHQRHLGLYARVAAKLGVAPSYVSLVANGRRHSDKIAAAISEELERTLKAAPPSTRS